jgi:hypothetical protein
VSLCVFSCAAQPLIDFDEAELVTFFVLHDNSIHFDDLKKSTVNLILISVLMIMVLSLIFNRILNKASKTYSIKIKIDFRIKRRIIADKKLIENNKN